MNRIAACLLSAGVLLAGTLASPPGDLRAAEPAKPLRVLFVGNSYLYTNDLPGMVRVLALARGVEVQATLRAEPDYALSDHLRRAGFDAQLDGPWDWIVLQQGPSGLPESRRELIESVGKISARSKRTQSPRIALMSAWPARRYAGMSLQAEASYRAAASGAGACVMPAATAWRLARGREGVPALYAGDGLHPTPHGSALAAMVVTDGLLGATADDAAADATATDDASDERSTLRLLRALAREAGAAEPATCAPGTPGAARG